jgi:hypothetical protein
VLDALARVLRLGTAERAHLFHLARVELPLPGGDYPREAPPELAANGKASPDDKARVADMVHPSVKTRYGL